MLPLKAFVNTLQNTLRYSNCLVRAFPFFDGGLEYQYPELVLEKPSDRFDIEFPEIRHFGRRVMPFDWSRSFQRIGKIGKDGGHRCLVRYHAVLATLKPVRNRSKLEVVWAPGHFSVFSGAGFGSR